LLLRTYEKGERVLFFIDRAAQLILNELLYKYGQAGGLKENNCGTYNGYNKLNTRKKYCFPVDVDENIIIDFRTRLYEFFKLFPELIPNIDYDLLLAPTTEMIGQSHNSLRMDVTTTDRYNFKVDFLDFYVTDKPPEPPPVIPPDQPPVPPGPPSPGKCGHVADYAMGYINCPYATIPSTIKPAQCNNFGLTCATLVSSSIVYTLGPDQYPYGHGKEKCEGGLVNKIGIDKSYLKPGDIFQSEAKKSGGGYTEWGHTGMYVGRGSVSNQAYGYSYCYHKFTPNPSGEYVFIHSTGTSQLGRPGVCFATYDQLFTNTIFVLTSFCRHDKCM
jgi:hypothetical protein